MFICALVLDAESQHSGQVAVYVLKSCASVRCRRARRVYPKTPAMHPLRRMLHTLLHVLKVVAHVQASHKTLTTVHREVNHVDARVSLRHLPRVTHVAA